MKRRVIKVLFILIWIIVLLYIFDNKVYAADKNSDHYTEMEKATYDGGNLKIGGDNKKTYNSSIINYTVEANDSRPLYETDEIYLQIYVTRAMWSGEMSFDFSENDKNKIGITDPSGKNESGEVSVIYDGVNHCRIKMKIKLKSKGDLKLKIKIQDNSTTNMEIDIKGVRSISDKVEKTLRDEWGANYKEANVFDERGMRIYI